MESQTIESLDDRLVNLTRLILASSALIIIYIDPSEPDRLVNITYTALVLYTVHSAIIYLLSVRHQSPLRGAPLHWIDVTWYLVLISLSSGTNSVFFFFFFFAILTASFRSGYRTGMRVTLVSAIIFATIGYLTTQAPIEPNRFLLRAVYLVSIGYLMAYWGGSEITYKRRLALLKDVSRLSNPRFGVDQTIGSIIRKLRDFYDADSCILINRGSATEPHLLRRVDRLHPELANRTDAMGTEGEALLLAWASEVAAIYYNGSSKWRFNRTSCSTYNLVSGVRAKDGDETCAWVADLLDATSFVTVPVYQRETFAGRLYLTSKRIRFTYSDADFLRQVTEHVIPMIDNVRLVDRFASEAFEYERQRISRDIHDSAIQPYIGLKLGLDAIRRKLTDRDPITRSITELADKTSSIIGDLRQYVGGLQQPGASERANILVSSVQSHAEKFGEFYDIRVAVDVHAEITMNDRLAAEVFQIVREGLSNIKRHTASTNAKISMASLNGELLLNIENDRPNGESCDTFTPRSIRERAVALGGRVLVDVAEDARTIVSVVIPL